MYKILIVEDEENMRLGLQDNLEFEGYEVDFAVEGNEGLRKILENKYDLVLLDVMLPNKSGFEICKEVRSKGIKTPVIHLTAKGEEIDKVLGLELGADDYITKPFSLRELLARVKAILRRTADSAIEKKSIIQIGNLNINFESFNAEKEGQAVSMTHKEFEILKYLWNHKNETVSREDLMKEIWGADVYTTTRTVDNFILKLRQKIENNYNQPDHIITVYGIGYKLINV